MMNQIRADFYRQRRTLGMYVIVLITIAYAVWSVTSKNIGGVTVHGDDNLIAQIAAKTWTAQFGVQAANMSDTLLLYFFIGVFVIVFGYEFSQKVYKNTLISGISRLQFVLAKYLVMLLDLLILFTVNFGIALLGGLAKGRALGVSWPSVLNTMGLSIVAATFFLSVIFSLGVFLLIATGSMTIATIVVVIFPILVGVIHLIGEWSWLKYIDFLAVSQNLGVGSMEMSELPPYITVSLGFLIVMIGSSAWLLQKKEL